MNVFRTWFVIGITLMIQQNTMASEPADKQAKIQTQLFFGLIKGSPSDVTIALNNGADVNQPFDGKPLEGIAPQRTHALKGFTPLMIASYFGRLGMVEELLKRDALANQENNQGKTALMLAVTSIVMTNNELRPSIVQRLVPHTYKKHIEAAFDAARNPSVLRQEKNPKVIQILQDALTTMAPDHDAKIKEQEEAVAEETEESVFEILEAAAAKLFDNDLATYKDLGAFERLDFLYQKDLLNKTEHKKLKDYFQREFAKEEEESGGIDKGDTKKTAAKSEEESEQRSTRAGSKSKPHPYDRPFDAPLSDADQSDMKRAASSKLLDDLILAASKGDIKSMKAAIEAGADVNESLNSPDIAGFSQPIREKIQGFTPLMIAASWGKLNAVNFLLQQITIDANKKNNDGQAALEVLVRVQMPDQQKMPILKNILEHTNLEQMKEALRTAQEAVTQNKPNASKKVVDHLAQVVSAQERLFNAFKSHDQKEEQAALKAGALNMTPEAQKILLDSFK